MLINSLHHRVIFTELLIFQVMVVSTVNIFSGCEGDSGGPAMNGKGELVGLTSFIRDWDHPKDDRWRPLGCGRLARYKGFVNLNQYHEWIERAQEEIQ